MRAALILTLLVLVTGCGKEVEAPVPDPAWDLFISNGTRPADATSQRRLEGVYTVTEGQELLGGAVVLKTSWARTGADTTYHLSLFGAQDIVLFTGEARYLDSTLLINGYWRQMANTNTGLCRFTIAPENGTRLLLGGGIIGTDSIRIEGLFGNGQEVPYRTVRLRYARPLHPPDGFTVLAHRGGGRNADLLPASENSVELIRMASRFGARGIEVDVRLTSDGVPVLYHDGTLNTRLIQDCGLFGSLSDYSYAQLSGIVRLINGERIPTLREALDAVVNGTDLQWVWLDLKSPDAVPIARALQQEFMVAGQDRGVTILLGLPDTDLMGAYQALPDHASAPALCELSPDDASSIGATVWAPRWTLGLQQAETAQMHAEGRKVFVWTMDLPEYVHEYLYDGAFDGMLSNYPSIVAYEAYARP